MTDQHTRETWGVAGETHVHRVDPVTAHEVAHRFLATPSSPHDATVVAAYAELESQSDMFFAAMTEFLGFRIVFTRCPDPYASDGELIAAVRASNLLEVTSACIDAERRHPLLDSSFAGPYDRFRAVHDVAGHVRLGTGFDREGEFTTWRAQHDQYRGSARWALATELHGEHSVLCSTGELAEHKAILLEPRLLARSRRGLCPASSSSS